MIPCVLYARFSPRRNADECESIQVQLEACRAYAQEHRYRILAEHADEAMSGGDEDRPGLWAAVEAVPRKGVLLVYSPDRLARDLYQSEYVHRVLSKRGATVETVRHGQTGDTAESVVLRQTLNAFAEYARKLNAARTSAAMLRHQAQGRRMGGVPPIGMQIDPDDPKRLIPDPDEAPLVDEIRRRCAAGEKQAAIARDLTSRGIRCRGQRWYAATVRRIVRRPAS